MATEVTSEADLPYRAEYAKSSRSSCKGCKKAIMQDTLRIGIMVQSPHFDGKVPLWHHSSCFFMKKQIKSTGDIANFQTLRWEDQKYIKDSVGGASGSGVKPKAKSKKNAAAAAASGENKEFSVDYAKSNRSECKVCKEKIEKGTLRISKIEYDSEAAHRFGPLPGWRHVKCFVLVREELGFTDSADKLPGYSSLNDEDKAMLSKLIKSKGGKRKLAYEEEKAPVPNKVQKANSREEKILQAQSMLVYSFRDNLKRNFSKKELSALLEINDQETPSGESNILDLLADCLTFGALGKCAECKTGQLSVRSFGYKCTGFLTGWTKCQYVTKTPTRKEFIVPDEFREYDFLKNYKYIKRERAFATNPDVPTQPNGSVSSSQSSKPLADFKIATAGNIKRTKAELETVISELGGKLGTKIDATTTCLISTKEFADAGKRQIMTAEKYNVPVVSEDFLDFVKGGGSALQMKQYLLRPWTGDVESRIRKPKLEKTEQPFKNVKSEQKVKIVVQGAAAVDPESGLEQSAHVIEKNGDIYNAVLGMVDVTRGTNSYYKLQALQSNRGNSFYVFRSWGRVGTTIGGNKRDSFETLQEATNFFKSMYLEKTGNEWKDRNNFVKQPNRFYPLDIDYGQDDSEVQKFKELKPGSSSTLPTPVQQLICLIFDVEAMKKAMLEFEIDLKKMPLGKLSKKQIQSAYSVLSELQQIIEGDKNATKLLDASNRFYTLIPHDFGMKKPPLVDNDALLKSKIDMLDNLLEIEVAYNLLKEGSSNVKDPIDCHYLQLKTDIEVLNKDCEEYKRIETYLKNTHAETHNQYALQLEDVFKIHRHGESERYTKKFKNLHNKQLLWHGSRTTNFAGILSQGLRIAPPEAPMTGYMFGKGIYFADMVSKSANYCFTSRGKPTGLLLLCEVALGNMYEKTDAESITKLPKDKHSTKGLGQTMPDPNETIVVDDVTIPLGKPVKSNVKRSALLYNEYIVYDVNQVNIRYLLKTKFNWRR